MLNNGTMFHFLLANMNNFEISNNWAIELIFKINPFNKKKVGAFNVIETFAGIGSQKKALSKISDFDYEILAISEWEVYALISYVAIHHGFDYSNDSSNGASNKMIWDYINSSMSRYEKISFLSKLNLSRDGKEPIVKDAENSERFYSNYSDEFISKIVFSCIRTRNFGDVNNLTTVEWSKLPKVNMLTYSFPCTDISNQGKQAGLFQSKRSSLLWSIQNFIVDYSNKMIDVNEKQIDFLLMENVPEIFTKFKDEFQVWKDALEIIGYQNWASTLNGLDFKVPQARKRAFMVSCWSKKYSEFNLDTFETDINSMKTDRKVSKPTVGELIKKIESHHLYDLEGKNNLYIYTHQYKSHIQLISSPSYENTVDKVILDENVKKDKKINRKKWNDVPKGWAINPVTTRTFKNYINKYKDGKEWSERSGYVIHEYGSFNSEYKIQLPWSPSSTLTATGALSRLKYYDASEGNGDIKLFGGPISYLLMGFDIEDVLNASTILKSLFVSSNYDQVNHKIEIKEYDNWEVRNMQNLVYYPNKADELLRKQAGNSIIVDVIFAIIDIISKIWKNRQ